MKDINASIAIGSTVAAAVSPMLGPPLLTWAVLAGGMIGSLIAVLFYLNSQESFSFKVSINLMLIFITGMAAAVFATSTVAFLLDYYLGIESGNGMGLIALILSFQGKQLFDMVGQIRSSVMNRISKKVGTTND